MHGVLAGKRLVLNTAIDESLRTDGVQQRRRDAARARVGREELCAISSNDECTAFIRDVRRKHIAVFLKDLLLDQVMLATALDDKRYRLDQPAARQAR